MKNDKSNIPNYMDINEFREEGYLQEVNRRFFHPLGLALTVEITDSGEERIGGINDFREDEEGVIYDLKNSDNDRIKKFNKNFDFITSELSNKYKTRMTKFGFVVEDIPKIK